MMFATLTFVALSLNDAQTRAVENSPAVSGARALVRERLAELSLARHTPLPHLFGDYSQSVQASNTNTSIEQKFSTVGIAISLDDILATSPAVRAASASLLGAERSFDAAVRAEREQTIRLYFAALQARAVTDFRTKALATATDDYNGAATRVKNGDAPRLDLLRAAVALAQARADLAGARAVQADALDALAVEAAVDPHQLDQVAEAPSVPAAAGSTPEEAAKRAAALRPEARSLLAAIDAQHAAIDAAARRLLPSVTANVAAQHGTDTGIPVNGSAVTVHLDLPIGNLSASTIDVERARLDELRAQLADLQRTLALIASASVRDAQAADDADTAAQQARLEAADELNAVAVGYREGASSSLDVTDARRTFIAASLSALGADYARAQAHALEEVIVP